MKFSIIVKDVVYYETNSGAIRSLTCHPSTSGIVTGERVLKYWHILATLNHLSRNSIPASDDQCSSKTCGLGHNLEFTFTGSLSGWAVSGCLTRRRSMLVGSALGIEVDVIAWLTLDKAPFRAQCSAYTTRARIDDVSRVARFYLRLLLVSISFLAKRRAVSHKPFQSPHWKRLALEMIFLYSLLWIDKTRTKDKRYKEVSVWWKTTN